MRAALTNLKSPYLLIIVCLDKSPALSLSLSHTHSRVHSLEEGGQLFRGKYSCTYCTALSIICFLTTWTRVLLISSLYDHAASY